MTKRRDPEQRSTSGRPAPGQSAAIPTGNEIYNTNQAETRRTHGPEPVLPATGMTEEEAQAALEQLQELAVEYYERLGETARQLTGQASAVYDTTRGFLRKNPGGSVLGAFALGVVIGVLSGRD